MATPKGVGKAEGVGTVEKTSMRVTVGSPRVGSALSSLKIVAIVKLISVAEVAVVFEEELVVEEVPVVVL